MATTTTTTTTTNGSENHVRYRSLSAAREAFAEPDSALSRELSREAHSLLRTSDVAGDDPGSPQLKAATWSPFVLSTEAGHVDELANVGMALLLSGAQHSIMGVLLAASLGDAAGLPVAVTAKGAAAVLLCCASYAACHQALDVVTYAAYHERERRREAWEMENFPEGEVEEMVQLYTKRGLPEHAARNVVTAMASSPEFFVDVMMLEELQMSPPPQISPVAAGLRSASGMLLGGGPMLLAHVLLDRVAGNDAVAASHRPAVLQPGSRGYVFMLVLCALAMAALGSYRAAITHQQRRRLAMQTCALAMPGVLLARLAGVMLLSDATL